MVTVIPRKPAHDRNAALPTPGHNGLPGKEDNAINHKDTSSESYGSHFTHPLNFFIFGLDTKRLISVWVKIVPFKCIAYRGWTRVLTAGLHSNL